jgi:hypothetical protein
VYAAAGSVSSTSETGTNEHSNANKPSAVPIAGSKTSLVILTATALTAAFTSTGSNATVALGLSYALVSAAGILLVQRAAWLAQSPRSNVIYSANGFLAQPEDAERSDSSGSGNSSSDVVRDVCAAAGLATLVASVTLESWHIGGLLYRSPVGNWVARSSYAGLAVTLAILAVHILMYRSLLLMVCYILCQCSLFVNASATARLLHASLSAPSLYKQPLDPLRTLTHSPYRSQGRAPSSPVSSL